MGPGQSAELTTGLLFVHQHSPSESIRSCQCAKFEADQTSRLYWNYSMQHWSLYECVSSEWCRLPFLQQNCFFFIANRALGVFYFFVHITVHDFSLFSLFHFIGTFFYSNTDRVCNLYIIRNYSNYSTFTLKSISIFPTISLSHQRLMLLLGLKIGPKETFSCRNKSTEWIFTKDREYRIVITDTNNPSSKKLVFSLFLLKIKEIFGDSELFIYISV